MADFNKQGILRRRILWRLAQSLRETVEAMAKLTNFNLENRHTHLRLLKYIVDLGKFKGDISLLTQVLELHLLHLLREVNALSESIASPYPFTSLVTTGESIYYGRAILSKLKIPDNLAVCIEDNSLRTLDGSIIPPLLFPLPDPPDEIPEPSSPEWEENPFNTIRYAIWFLKMVVCLNMQDGDYSNVLRRAYAHDQEGVVKLIGYPYTGYNNARAAVAAGQDYGSSLQAACADGDERVVKLLLANGADIDAQGGYHGSPLNAACVIGRYHIVKILLNKGATVDTPGGSGRFGNALQAASVYNKDSIVQLLLNAKVDVNIRGGYYGTALVAACDKSHHFIIELLLARKADVNIQVNSHGNALQVAARRGSWSLVKRLLNEGADVTAPGGKHGNALEAARAGKNRFIVELILEHLDKVSA